MDVRAGGAAELRRHPERPEDGRGEVLARTASPARAATCAASSLEALVRVDAALARPARSADRRRTAARSRGRADAGRSSRAARPARPGRPRPPRPRRASRAPSRASSPTPSGRRGPQGRDGRRRRPVARPRRRRARRPTRRSGEGRPRRAILASVERRLIPGHSPYEPVVGYSRAVVSGGRRVRVRHGADPARGRTAGGRLRAGAAVPRDRRRRARRGGCGLSGRRADAHLPDRRRRLGGGRAGARRGVLGDPARHRPPSSSKACSTRAGVSRSKPTPFCPA